MKRTITALVLVLSAALLFGCAVPAPNAQGGAETTQNVPAVEVEPGEAAYTMTTQDVSFKDDDGNVLISMTFTYPVFAETVVAAQQLNAAIEQRVAAFVAQREQIAEHLEHPMLATDGPFFYDVTTTVLNNSGDLISLRFSEEWFMGGVHNSGSDSVTYSLTSGEEQTLKSVFPEDEQNIRDAILTYFRETAGEDMITDAETALAAYAYEEIPFYLDNGEAVVHFSIFEFANGAFGEPVIHTGVVIGG